MRPFRKFQRWGTSVVSLNRLLPDSKVVLQSRGCCPTCKRDVKFVARDPWLRAHYICSNCGSIPRERALMVAIEEYFPDWRNLTIHESSPCDRGASLRLRRECADYIPSHFYPGVQLGSCVKGVRCENLEALTFADESIDLHVTQDVMEHIFRPAIAFREIARTLKPGGAHVFTVPLVNKQKPSKLRVKMSDSGELIHVEPPIYHGNPISQDGALVTVDWGFDICKHIFEASGLFTHLLYRDDINRGIRAEYIEVLITMKPGNKGDANFC